MNSKAFGVIETIGLVGAVEAADAAIKSANVVLLGYDLAMGGMVAVGFTGDVGAVKAALEAGTAAAERIGKVYARLIIPRPHTDTEALVARFKEHPDQSGGKGGQTKAKTASSGSSGKSSSGSKSGAKKSSSRKTPKTEQEPETTPAEPEAQVEEPKEQPSPVTEPSQAEPQGSTDTGGGEEFRFSDTSEPESKPEE
jgi:ethanolamine utilization protein EutM